MIRGQADRYRGSGGRDRGADAAAMEPGMSRVPIVSILTGVLALTVTTPVVAGTLSVKPRGELAPH